MSANTDKRFSPADLLIVLAAVVLLVGLFLPWTELRKTGDTVTGWDIIRNGAELKLAARMSHMFLEVVLVAGVAALLLGVWGFFSSRYDRRTPILVLALGMAALVYYYGAFIFENRTTKDNAWGFVHIGFYVSALGALGLIVQYWLPRAQGKVTLTLTPLKLPPLKRPRMPLLWPLAVLGGVWGWFKALVGWTWVQFRRAMVNTSTLAFLLGIWASTELELRAGSPLAEMLGFRRGRVPGLLGATKLLEPFSDLDFSGILAPFFPAPTDVVDKPVQQSWDAIRELGQAIWNALFVQNGGQPNFFNVLGDVIVYDLLIYLIPVMLVALLLRSLSNGVLLRLPFWGGLTLQLAILYMAVSTWGSLNDYRELVLIYMGVNIMLSVSLNLVNGYMGEFSVGHAGFMAVGAYVSSVLTMRLLVDTKFFGPALLNAPQWALPIGFAIALVAGGVAAAIAGLMVAFPSFRTRGDYLAIVTLAVNFIVTGVINNIEAIGGPRGLNGVPIWTNFTWVFVMTVLSVLAIYNLVTSTFGKGIIAIREDEIAAELMGVHTQRVKLVAFLVSSFIAGVAGGLFAHVLAYVNPGVFGILKSTEVLVMVYLGGMGSISGSVIAAVIFTILIEAFRPLAVLKWVVIPLILILLMLYRPQGLYGFREMSLNLRGVREDAPKEVRDDAVAGD